MDPTQNQENNPLPNEDASLINEPVNIEKSLPKESAIESTMATTSTNLTATNGNFTDFTSTFLFCFILFIVSSVGGFLSGFFEWLSMIVYLWYIAAVISLISVVVFFFTGMYQGIFAKKSFKLVGVSILFLVILSLVGAGTYFVNMNGLGL